MLTYNIFFFLSSHKRNIKIFLFQTESIILSQTSSNSYMYTKDGLKFLKQAEILLECQLNSMLMQCQFLQCPTPCNFDLRLCPLLGPPSRHILWWVVFSDICITCKPLWGWCPSFWGLYHLNVHIPGSVLCLWNQLFYE